MAIDKLHGKRVNTVRKKRTKKRLSSRYRNSLFSQLKQMAEESNTPKAGAMKGGPFKGIVIRVEHECQGGGLNIFGGLSFMKYWFEGIMESTPPEIVKVKVRIPGLHDYIPDPQKYGCDPGPWQKFIDLHPTFTAGSQAVEPPAVGDLVIVDFSDTETESDPIVIANVVVRETDAIAPSADCPTKDVFNSAAEEAPLAVTSEEGDAQGGTQTEPVADVGIPGASDTGAGPAASPGYAGGGDASSSPFNTLAGIVQTAVSVIDQARSAAGETTATLPPVIARFESGDPNPIALPQSKKGIFIKEESLGKTAGLETPLAAVKRASWAGFGFVAIEAATCGPPYGTVTDPEMRKGNIEKIKKYVRAFRTAGMSVYLWGTPWPGLAREYVNFMSKAVKTTGAYGVIMSPSWGYFSERNANKYSAPANYLSKAMIAKAKEKNFVVGFTCPWNPAAPYKAGTTEVTRFRECFPYACFTNVDFTVAQLLSQNGNSARYANEDGAVDILSLDGQYAVESDVVFAQGLQDYINYGFPKIIPAFGALGTRYHDYGYDTRKPPQRMQEEIEFVLSGSTTDLTLKPAGDNGYGYFDVEGVEESVMWWDWASANDNNPCWDNDRWNIIRNFNSYGLSADLASIEGGVGTNIKITAGASAEYAKAMRGIEMFKQVATTNGWLEQSELDKLSPPISKVSATKMLAASTMSELKELSVSAASTLKSSTTELGYDSGGTSQDPEAPPATSWLDDSPYDVDDLGVVMGSTPDPVDETAEGPTNPFSLAATGVDLSLSKFIDYNNPADPWQFKGGWCPVHHYTTGGKGMKIANRTPSDIYYVLIHTTAGRSMEAGFGWFNNPDCQAATHYGVNAGGYIFQGVREKDIAYHAGEKSSSRRHPNDKYSGGRFNSNGIGIEIAGTLDGEQAQPGRFYSEEMYNGLAFLVAGICNRNGITPDRQHIIGHDEFRKDKVDPGSDLIATGLDPAYQFDSVFDWEKFLEKVSEFLSGAGAMVPSSSGFPSGPAPSPAMAGAGGQSPGECGPGPGGASTPGGVNPTTIMPLSEVADTSPASAAGSAFQESSVNPPGIITLRGVSDRGMVAADISALPDGPTLTFDYTPDTTNFGKSSTTKIIDQLPIATDLAHYLWAMIKAAEADGIPLKLNSVWRNSPNIDAGGSGAGTWKMTKGQQHFWDIYQAGTGNPAARPGRSKHQLGLAVDIAGTSPVGSAIFEWLSKNAEAFGFYRSVSSERWHWVLDPSKNKYASVAADHTSWQN